MTFEIKPSKKIRVGFWILGLITFVETTKNIESLSGKLLNLFLFIGLALVCDPICAWAFGLLDE